MKPVKRSLSICSGLAAMAVLFAFATTQGWAGSFEPETDRPGSDYRSFWMDSANAYVCQNACAAERRCQAWTFVKPGVQGSKARCWLKGVVPRARSANCCISGVKGGGGSGPGTSSAALRCTPADWAGTWDTGRYKNMTLNVTGYDVSGTYNVQNHQVWGSLNRGNPCVLEGYWKHASGSLRGRVRFVMTRPGHFEGTWRSGNAEPTGAVNWTGDKMAASGPGPGTRFQSRWDKTGGPGGLWTTGWIPNHTFQGCGHGARGCSCGGQNYCGTYRDGATTYWWPKGCGGPRWTIRCTSVPQ